MVAQSSVKAVIDASWVNGINAFRVTILRTFIKSTSGHRLEPRSYGGISALRRQHYHEFLSFDDVGGYLDDIYEGKLS
ncbi:DNA mismatch repair protein MutS [Trichinella pseudospiralis]